MRPGILAPDLGGFLFVKEYMNPSDMNNYSDRDLLVSLHTRVGIIADSVTDHEKRIRKSEHDAFMLKGAGSLATILLGLIEPLILWKHK